MGMVNYDGAADGAVEMGAITAGATDPAENLTDAATAADGQADSAIGGEGATDASAVENNGQPAMQWDGSQFTLKYRDKPVVPQSREELVKWAQLGYNNDLRMRNLDTRESKLTERERALEQVKQISEAFDQRPDFKQAVLDVYQKLASGQQAAAEQSAEQLPEGIQDAIAPYVDEIRTLKSELQNIKGRFQEFDTSKADEAVKSEIEDLKKEFSSEDWDTPDSQTEKTLLREVIEHASENNFPSLKAAYRDMRWEAAMANAKAEALKNADAAKQNEQRAGIVGKGGPGAPAPAPRQVNVRNVGYNDLAQMAMADMK
jgi:chromosome segregation ATPase